MAIHITQVTNSTLSAEKRKAECVLVVMCPVSLPSSDVCSSVIVVFPAHTQLFCFLLFFKYINHLKLF